jgi:nucleotide-binding universal stress UspA family protein
MKSRILIAVDGSDVSLRALERVARFLKEDADVAIVTVARPIYRDPRYTGYADPGDEEEQRRILYAARDALHRKGIAATGLAPTGDPADEIVAAAKQFQAELVVMGARSLGAVERLVLGSVNTKVMHQAVCDVLIVK